MAVNLMAPGNERQLHDMENALRTAENSMRYLYNTHLYLYSIIRQFYDENNKDAIFKAMLSFVSAQYPV